MSSGLRRLKKHLVSRSGNSKFARKFRRSTIACGLRWNKKTTTDSTMKLLTKSHWLPVAFCCLLIGLLAGCATKKVAPKKYTYFPSPPDDPRIQFLTTFESDAQLGRSRSFSDYIIGESKPSSPLIKPYGLAVHDGKVFVCDTVAGNIMVF